MLYNVSLFRCTYFPSFGASLRLDFFITHPLTHSLTHSLIITLIMSTSSSSSSSTEFIQVKVDHSFAVEKACVIPTERVYERARVVKTLLPHSLTTPQNTSEKISNKKKESNTKVVNEQINSTNKLLPHSHTQSIWHFSDQCTQWRKHLTPIGKIAPHLTSIDTLRYEGFYEYTHKHWRRYYCTSEGIVITLLEDVPECGGQNCLWAAGLVMAR